MDNEYHESVSGAAATPYLVELVQQKKLTPGKVLEIGCANGANSIFLAGAGFDVTAVDMSETAIEFARENAEKAKVNVSFLAADARRLNFTQDTFDLIIDWGAFHAIPEGERSEFVEGVRERTNSNAKLLLRVLSSRDASADEEQSVGRKRQDFTRKQIEEAFHGFKVLEQVESDINVGPITNCFDQYLLEKTA